MPTNRLKKHKHMAITMANQSTIFGKPPSGISQCAVITSSTTADVIVSFASNPHPMELDVSAQAMDVDMDESAQAMDVDMGESAQATDVDMGE